MSRPLKLVEDTLAQQEGGAPVFQSVHIDDVAQECHGSFSEIFGSITKAGGCFISSVQAMGLEVSSKSVILSSSVAPSE